MTVWVMVKQWFDDCGIVEECTYAFSSFKSANKAMYKDWVLAYGSRLGKNRPDTDRFWESQVAPFESDWEAAIQFRDQSKINWHIHECEVEN